jgi:prepilin signal peptidase PulO-like enzyme (type II secretory pathway)
MECFFFFYIFVFLLGLAVGSFLNCIIYRLEKNESFLKGRSYCPNCHHTLAWQDLIPIFSFLILKGKCRYCGKKISLQYPLVELATGILFFSIFYSIFQHSNIPTFQQSIQFLYLSIVSSFLIVIFVYDLKHYLIPDKVIYPAIALALIFNFQFLISKQLLIFKYAILSAVLASAFFLSIFLISRGKWLGFGDVKLGFLMGLFLGFPKILVALFSAYLIGAIIGIGLVLAKKKTLKSEVPFGPFLVSGTFIALFFGNQLINWYLGFIQITP